MSSCSTTFGVTIPAHSSHNVTVTYATGSSSGAGSLTLTAQQLLGSFDQASATITVTVAPPNYPTIASATEAPGTETTPDTSFAFAFPITQKASDGSWSSAGTVTGQRVTVPTGGDVAFTVGVTDSIGLDHVTWDIYDPGGALTSTYNTALSGSSDTASISQPLIGRGVWKVAAGVTNSDGHVRAVTFSADASGSEPTHASPGPWTIVTPHFPLATTNSSVDFTVTFCHEDTHTGLTYHILLDDVDVTSNFHQSLSVPVPSDCDNNVPLAGTLTVSPGSHILSTDVHDSDSNWDTWEDTWVYNPYVVTVTPAETTVVAIGRPQMTQTFVVNNIGTASAIYDLDADCNDGASGCSVSSSQTSSLAPGASDTVTVSYTAGGAGTHSGVTFVASHDAAATGLTQDAGEIAVTAPFTVAVSPVNEEVGAEIGVWNEQSFTLRNTASIPITYLLTPVCSGAGVSGCDAPDSLALAAHDSALVSISYLASDSGEVGTVALRAEHKTDSLNSATGSVHVTVGAPSAGILDRVPSLADVERSLCITASAGAAAAYECGDLRIVHPLPAIQTLGRPRAPVLLYNSQHAHPHPIVASNVELSAEDPLPDSVVATLLVDGVEHAHGEWAGSEWVAGGARRIAVAYDASTTPTGLYPYSLEIRRWASSGSVALKTDTGQLAIVNRSSSEFGAGWWLAGLEQLFFPSDSSILWVGGDGSTRRFHADPNTPDVWHAASLDQPDSLVHTGGYYIHHLRGGISVKYDETGKHVATIGRHELQTTFAYDTTGTIAGALRSITVPLGPAPTYTFAYTNGVLDSVIAPAADGGTRAAQVTASSGRITAIRDAGDTVAVSFAYDTSYTNRIIGRTDRRGNEVSYVFGPGAKLSGATLTPSIVYGFRAAEAKGLSGSGASGAVAPKDMNTEILGPRTDVADNTYLWINQFGSPTRIRDALGQTTVVAYDTTWPVLPAVVRSPTGHVTSATYTPQGLLSQAVDSSLYRDTLGTRTYAKTIYEWDDHWQFLEKITLPEGEITEIHYDTSTGDRSWQQTGPDVARRVTFGYDSLGLMRWLKAPLTPAASLSYDLAGNLSRHVDASGFQTLIFRDGLGRDTLTITPVDTITARDSAQLYAAGVRHRTVYDIIGHVDTTVTLAPPTTRDSSGVMVQVPGDAVYVNTTYDAEGAPLTVARWVIPDSAAVGVLVTSYDYDEIGRLVSEAQPGGSGGQFELDPAGNRISWTTSKSDFITMTYDALNRLKARVVPEAHYPGRVWYKPIIEDAWDPGFYAFPRFGNDLTLPADTSRFAYDADGNMTSATNRWARVWRSYAPSGLLTSDSIHIQPYTEGITSPTQHIYGLQYDYDLDGRRTEIRHPESLAPTCPGGSGVCDQVHYEFDPETGALATIHGLANDMYSYSYDDAGRLTRLTFPGGVYDSTEYDIRGMSRRLLKTPTREIFDDNYTRDPLGRVLEVVTDVVNESHNSYSPLGHLTYSQWEAPSEGGEITEEYRADALGHHYWRRLGGDSTYRYEYIPNTGELKSTYLVPQFALSFRDTSEAEFDDNGNREFSWRISRGASVDSHITYDVSASYYDAENRLRVVDRRYQTTTSVQAPRPDRYEEYRYDALGRRIMRRVRWDATCTIATVCGASAIERFVWDGNQLLYEIRGRGADSLPASVLESMPSNDGWYGVVGYLHGLGIDSPLSVTKGDEVIIPHANWRGVYAVGTALDGDDDVGCTATSVDNPCMAEWPAPSQRTMFHADALFEPATWHGSLIMGQRDASGLMYMRNRYYDPQSGRFTQEDPIGLAGGLNLYGFANGDPVNYSDPFGLDTLSNREKGSLGNSCQKVDCEKVKVHRGNDGAARNVLRRIILTVSRGRAVTLGQDIYLPDKDAHDVPTLAHEITHAGQYQTWGAGKYYKEAMKDRMAEAEGGDPYALPSPLPSDKSFDSYGMEQQGQIVQNCFSGQGSCDVSPYHPPKPPPE